MALVKRFTLAAMFLVLAAPIALAGPNAGGVLVVHATELTYSTDPPGPNGYVGFSGVGCGQDGPLIPQIGTPSCPPYDPIDGADPCVPTAAVPTCGTEPGDHVWYVLAAFDTGSCPRLKTLGFRIQYDAEKVHIVANGAAVLPEDIGLALPVGSSEDGEPFPSNRSGIALTFSPKARTSQLQELWWFAGHSESGASDATFAVQLLDGLAAGNDVFVDDSSPNLTDAIAGFGTLGLGGAAGNNPTPISGEEPTGSCCVTDGTCTVVTQAACTALPGTWTLSGTCVPNLCDAPDVEGACCSLGGLCTLVMRDVCVSPLEWYAGPLCEPNPCPTLQGACCAQDGTCTLTILVECASPATWHNDFTACVPNPCPPPSPTESKSWGQIKSIYAPR